MYEQLKPSFADVMAQRQIWLLRDRPYLKSVDFVQLQHVTEVAKEHLSTRLRHTAKHRHSGYHGRVR